MNELRECPFCGSDGEIVSKVLDSGTVYRVRCRLCYAQSPYRANPVMHGFHTTVKKAADAWNRRADNE